MAVHTQNDACTSLVGVLFLVTEAKNTVNADGIVQSILQSLATFEIRAMNAMPGDSERETVTILAVGKNVETFEREPAQTSVLHGSIIINKNK